MRVVSIYSQICVYLKCFVRFFMTALPPAAVFRFPWEFTSGVVQDGDSVRTFGRLVDYQPEESKATLLTQHASQEHRVVVHTALVEPFNPIHGAQYLVLGVGVVVHARVLNCVDGVNIALLQKAITEQRDFFNEREQKQDGAARSVDAT